MPQPGPIQPHSAGDPGSGYDDAGRFIGTPPDAPEEGVEANPMIDPTSIAAAKFGNLIRGTKAADLVNAVRAQRASRILANEAGPSQEMALGAGSAEAPTFGQAMKAAEMPAPAEQAAGKLTTPADAGNASGESAASSEAISRTASEKAKGQVRFLVDVRSGHFKPVIGGVDAADVSPAQHEILVQMGVGKNPNAPTILGQGKSVTSAAIARLQDPKRGITPKLHPAYNGPPAVMAALGVQQKDTGGSLGTEEETPAGQPPPMPGGAAEVNPSTPGMLRARRAI